MRLPPGQRIPHYVYLLKWFNEVVYVGCTSNLYSRMLGHRKKEHNNVEVFKFENKPAALVFERNMLVKYFPKYNWIPPHLRSK